MARKPLGPGVLLYVVLCCAAFAPVTGVTNKLYEWARADNTDPAIKNQLNDCYGLVISPDDKYIYGITREESSLITMEYDKNAGTVNVLDVKTKGGPGITGLDHPAAIVMSPNGEHIYVTSPIESTVTHYKRDPDTGMLIPQETLKDGRDEVTSLWGAGSMSISEDGKRLYVAGKTDNSVTTFNVSPDDGTLTVSSVVTNDNSGGLHAPSAVTTSHDGNYVYAVSPTQSYMTVMRRDPITGVLAVTQRLLDTSKQWGLDAVEAMVVSNDDKQVYVLSSSGALTVFARYDGNANEPLVPVRRYLEGLDSVTGLIGGRGLAITPDGSTVIVAAETGKVTMFGRSSDGFLNQVGQLTSGDVAGVNKASRVAVSSTGTVVVGGWGLVSALETTESPRGPIPPPQTERAPRAPTIPRAPSSAANGPSPPAEPKAPRAPRAPSAPKAPGEYDSASEYDSNSLDYLESGEALGPPPAKIDVIPTGKKKITFPTGTVLGVAGGLLAFTIIAVLADRSATNNFCRPLRKKMGGRSSSEMQMRGGSMGGSMGPSTGTLVDAEAPGSELQMSVPAGAEDVVLEAIPLASPQAAAPLEGFEGASQVGDHNV